MPSAIVVSRRIYLSALVVALLLILVVIGSGWVRAQGLCEYVPATAVCIDDKHGTIRAVLDPNDTCTDRETPALLAHKGPLCCAMGGVADLSMDSAALEDRVTLPEERLGACKACK
jgi:hypothetical protein